MATIGARIQREPALITGLVGALIAAGVSFGLDLSGDQTSALMGVTVAVLALITRSQVTPVEPPKHRNANTRV